MSEERVKVWSTPPIATGGRAVNSAVAELAEFPRWVVWKAEQRNGKPSKVPYQVGGRRRASSTDPKTWSDFDSCWKSAFVDGDATGIGIVVTDGPDHLMAADIDHCIAKDGTIAPWAMDVVRRFNSYTEISPSGTGLRVFFLGTMPDEGREVRYQGGHLELYRTKRYLTVTGAHLSGTPSGIMAVEPCIIADLLGATTKTDGKTNGEAQTETIDAIGEISDELRDRLNDAIADDPALWAAWSGEAPEGTDQTRSAFDLKLAGALRRHGGCSLQDFATLARWWGYGKGKDGDPRHWRRTWEAAEPKTSPPPGTPPKLISAKVFIAGYVPPSYAIDGLIQRTRFYSLTAPTGHGKTAVSLRLGVHQARGENLNGRTVDQGNVVYFAAENPDDAKARMILMADRLGLTLESLPFYFVEGGFNINDWGDHIRTEVERIGGAITLYVDTGPAFLAACGFVDENDNMQALKFAWKLRALTGLPGHPAVIVPTHPIKNAGKDNLIPRGGSAFLNETDGNLVLWAEGERETTELHWAGKLRGPSFDPIVFALEKGTCPELVDAKGRQVPSVWAYLADQRRADHAASRQREDEDALLIAMDNAPNRTLSEWAENLGWRSASGEPLKSRVHRTLERLKDEKLTTQTRGRWGLTARGKREAERLQEQAA